MVGRQGPAQAGSPQAGHTPILDECQGNELSPSGQGQEQLSGRKTPEGCREEAGLDHEGRFREARREHGGAAGVSYPLGALNTRPRGVDPQLPSQAPESPELQPGVPAHTCWPCLAVLCGKDLPAPSPSALGKADASGRKPAFMEEIALLSLLPETRYRCHQEAPREGFLLNPGIWTAEPGTNHWAMLPFVSGSWARSPLCLAWAWPSVGSSGILSEPRHE